MTNDLIVTPQWKEETMSGWFDSSFLKIEPDGTKTDLFERDSLRKRGYVDLLSMQNSEHSDWAISKAYNIWAEKFVYFPNKIGNISHVKYLVRCVRGSSNFFLENRETKRFLFTKRIKKISFVKEKRRVSWAWGKPHFEIEISVSYLIVKKTLTSYLIQYKKQHQEELKEGEEERIELAIKYLEDLFKNVGVNPYNNFDEYIKDKVRFLLSLDEKGLSEDVRRIKQRHVEW